MNLPEMQYLRNRMTGQVKCSGHIDFVENEVYEVVIGFPPDGLWEGEQPMPKPILDGATLVAFLRGLFKNRTLEERTVLLTPLINTFAVLEGDGSISQMDYDYVYSTLAQKMADLMSPEQIVGVKAAVDAFLVDFEELK